MDSHVHSDHVYAIMLATLNLLTAAVVAHVIEAVFMSATTQSASAGPRRLIPRWTGQGETRDDPGSFTLVEGGQELSDANVVAVVQGHPGRPTILVSDEKGLHGTQVRRLRFFGDCPSESLQHADSRLVSHTIQTEMVVHDGSVDRTLLSANWNRLMVASLVYTASARIPLGRACVLGHGCGALSSFLSEVLLADVTAVEKDEIICELARDFFSDSTRVHIGDAVQFILESASESSTSQTFDVVFVDINAENHEPLDAPPSSVYGEEIALAFSRITSVLLVNVLATTQTGLDQCPKIEGAFALHFPHTKWLHSPLCSNRILVAIAQKIACAPSNEILNTRLEGWMKQSKALAQSLNGLEYGVTIFPQG